MPATPDQLTGSWRLQKWTITDDAGQVKQPMGPNPFGLLIYAADGYMTAMLAMPGRTPFAGNDPLGGSEKEAQAAMSTCHAYCGRWRIEGETVIHDVEMALWPNMVGTQQVRYYRLDGDRVVLKTPPMTRKGASGIAELTWQKVRA